MNFCGGGVIGVEGWRCALRRGERWMEWFWDEYEYEGERRGKYKYLL